ncbi:MAG: hypothetical protein HYY49_08890 [Ignavibacteriales bacterium]|nr:hypothetical protein [Ignavibacteriales bacterium]
MADNEQFENPEDFELTHHVVPGEPGRDHIEEMAETFIIEFKRMRWSDEAILAMFRNPFNAGPYYVFKERGETFVMDLLSRCVKSKD